MVIYLDMLYPVLFCGCYWVFILCGAVSVEFFNSTAFQGVGVAPGESSLGLVVVWRDKKKTTTKQDRI